jgi:hypothetical protein
MGGALGNPILRRGNAKRGAARHAQLIKMQFLTNARVADDPLRARTTLPISPFPANLTVADFLVKVTSQIKASVQVYASGLCLCSASIYESGSSNPTSLLFLADSYDLRVFSGPCSRSGMEAGGNADSLVAAP